MDQLMDQRTVAATCREAVRPVQEANGLLHQFLIHFPIIARQYWVFRSFSSHSVGGLITTIPRPPFSNSAPPPHFPASELS